MGSIDRFFDVADDVMDGFDGVLGIIEDHRRKPAAATAAPAPAAAPPPRRRRQPEPRVTETAIVQRRPGATFKVHEVIEESGETTWVVTDGRERAVCSSAELAEKVRVALG